jgi:hypothetical protein
MLVIDIAGLSRWRLVLRASIRSERPPLRLLDGMERATGTEPAGPAWKAAPMTQSEASIGGQAGSQCRLLTVVDRC